MKVMFVACTSPHFFRGSHCPFDGWSSPYQAETDRCLEALRAQGLELTRANLRAQGLSLQALARIVIVDAHSELGRLQAFVAQPWPDDAMDNLTLGFVEDEEP
jgi:hypothetical protein